MYTAPKLQSFIPGIWADSLMRRLFAEVWTDPFIEEFVKEHLRRMEEDPEYARTIQEREAADETESYWTAFFDNWFPPEYDEDDWEGHA